MPEYTDPYIDGLDSTDLQAHLRYYIGAVRTDTDHLADNAEMLAKLVERLLDTHTSSADNTDSVKSTEGGVDPDIDSGHAPWLAEMLGMDTPDPTVSTWTYSKVNPGGADVSHGHTFTGTDTEWAEHLAELVHQGIEVYNVRH